MARRSLRPHLNQIRTWVRQGRTDAWVAHQLEVDGEEIARFKTENELVVAAPDDGDPAVAPEDVDLRAEDDARISAELEAAEQERRAAEQAREAAEEERRAAEKAKRTAAGDDGSDDGDDDDDDTDDGQPKRRRRRGGRRRRRGSSAETVFEGTFDHGDEGYGLWLDPAVADSAVYAEHWSGHRPVEVTVEGDQIVIRRAGEGAGSDQD